MKIGDENLIIQKSDRRTLSLTCQQDGSLFVRAPKSMSDRKIHAFLEEKRDWIVRARTRVRNDARKLDALRLVPGGSFWFLGRDFQLTDDACGDGGVALDLEKQQIHLGNLDENQAMTAFLCLVRKAAGTYLPGRTLELARHMELSFNRLVIRDQKSRWGSCSSKGNISRNARIMLAPPEVIDYLIVHELAHLVHMYHARSFYELVARHCPDYRTHRRWLKEHGHLLRWGRKV